MHSIVVAKFVPWPTDSGDKRRTLGLVRELRRHGRVTLCAFAGPDDDPAPLEAEGITVRSVPLKRRTSTILQGLALGRSLTAARFWDPRLAREIVAAAGAGVDALVLGHVQFLPYARGVPALIPVVDMQNIESALTRRTAQTQKGLKALVFRAEARALRALERRVVDVDVVSVVSEADRKTLASLVDHSRVVVVPNAWDEVVPLPPAAAPVVSFVALLSWAPNADAATWFCRAVWPLVVDQLPGARLQLVGRSPTEAVRELADDTIQVTGTVPDLEPWYARTRVCIAPLRAGGGSRLKILEALAAARPVVATTVGAEGLEDLIGRGVVVEDDPAGMAAVIVRLLSDPEGTAALGRQGAAAVTADHTWSAAVRPLLAELAKGPTRPAG